MSQTHSIDYAQMTVLGDIARVHGRDRPHSVALSFEGRETNYAALDRRTNQIAHTLLGAGVSKGDRVGYLGKNSDVFFELLLACGKTGAVLTPIGWRLAPAEVAFILGNAEVKVVFVEVGLAALAEHARSSMTAPPHVVEFGTGSDFDAWCDAASAEDPRCEVAPRDVAVQLYTSGTTGNPKGAMLSHDNLISIWRRSTASGLNWDVWTPDDVSLVATPVSHIGGTAWGMRGLLAGSRNVVVREFAALEALRLIERERISKLFLVPATLQAMVVLPEARGVDYSRLKYILYGASPIALDLLRECVDVFGCGFCQLYGMTETAGANVYLPPEDHDAVGNPRMRAAGVPMPGVEIRIVDEAGATLPAGAIGQVATRSAANMIGYWRLDAATAATIDSDGWLLTGDAGSLDEDGYLYICDRIKDMIISGGENIYPTEVENAIYGHAKVADVAVIGVPDDKWGEAVKALVVVKPNTSATAEEIISFARTRIAAFKAPKSVEFVAALPRNASGKILRREVRDRFWAGRERRVN
jgi:acyl-CoA synthetase (AMP-forming)/AMP-acid ligase II